MNYPIRKILVGLIMLVCVSNLHAQDSLWTLQRCIDYAKEHNLTIQTAIINERISKMQVERSKIALLPNVSLSSSYGKSFGRSINPTSNQFENNNYE